MNTVLSNFRFLTVIILMLTATVKMSAIDLMPDHISVQSGGGMGIVSLGPGWEYGSAGQWETELIFGLVPKYSSNSAKLAIALKENYAPWHIALNDRIGLTPFSASIYLTTLVSKRLWVSQPDRYPSGYYSLSTKIRANISIGQRVDWRFRDSRRVRAVAIFYEIGTCDIYAMNAWGNSSLSPTDWLQLCIGARICF